jgi:hypothetical protein
VILLGVPALFAVFLGVAFHIWPLLLLDGLLWAAILISVHSRLRAKGSLMKVLAFIVAANVLAWLLWWTGPRR